MVTPQRQGQNRRSGLTLGRSNDNNNNNNSNSSTNSNNNSNVFIPSVQQYLNRQSNVHNHNRQSTRINSANYPFIYPPRLPPSTARAAAGTETTGGSVPRRLRTNHIRNQILGRGGARGQLRQQQDLDLAIGPFDSTSDINSEENLLAEINRISTRSLINEMTGNPDAARIRTINSGDRGGWNDNDQNAEFMCGTEHDSGVVANAGSAAIDLVLDAFLKMRRSAGAHYDFFHTQESLRQKEKKVATRKRRFEDEADSITSAITRDEFKFATIRPHACSFFRSGAKYVEDIESYSISFLHIDMKNMSNEGYLEFPSPEFRKVWIADFAPHYIPQDCNISNKKTSCLWFKSEIIDFEKFDLRYESMLKHSFDLALEMEGRVDEPESFHLIYNNCLVRKQLSRWMILKPFKGLTMKSMVTLITCPDCLEKVQRRFILLRLFFRSYGKVPDLLGCIDRATGIIELVAAEGKHSVITEHMLHEREISHYDQNDCVVRLSRNTGSYSSSLITLS